MTRPEKIISGGQTGADQAALAAAAEMGIPTGGFAPKGFMTEDGPAPWLAERYGLAETSSIRPVVRTKMNVAAADGTVWIGVVGTPGAKATLNAAVAANMRPFITNPAPEELREWVERREIRVLNVAGNRASKNPGVAAQVRALLIAAFGDAR